MLAITQANFDKMKKEIVEKERVLEEKNREILRLRI